MNLSAPFVVRPIATTLLMVGLTLLGAVAYMLLPIAGVPQADVPTIRVTAKLPGANAETMAASVAAPLESQLALMSGVASIISTSSLGQTSIQVEFELGRTSESAAQDVQTAINAAGGLLPKNLPNPPTYDKSNPADWLLMSIAVVPFGVLAALYLREYAKAGVVVSAVRIAINNLAGVPSIVFGLWGANALAPGTLGLATWLNTHLGWLPLFAGPVSVTGRTMLVVGVTLAVMILPIITAVTREVFVQTPRGQVEAALALGATRWEVVRTTVLPFGLSGYISGAMLGLGRALGETIALLIILRGTQKAFGWTLFDAGYTFASKIAAAASEFNDQYKAGAYIAA